MLPGSQQSYITYRLKKRLRLPSSAKKTVSILTFGSREETRQCCDVVKIGVRANNGGEIELKLLAVPIICEPLARPDTAQYIQQYPHFQHLQLADPRGGEPDILIGSDFYWEFLTGEPLRGNTGPTAIHTRVGWILSGPVTVAKEEQNPSTLVTHVLKVEGCAN